MTLDTILSRFAHRLLAVPVLLCCLPLLSSEANAMPSFARQTGMVCTSCHVGQYPVPLFTRTGRMFSMRGYVRPVIRARIETPGQIDDERPQYGGDYLALNWNEFWSARFQSEFARGGETRGGDTIDTESRPLSRMAMFYTGPITDWIGLWTEIGYLGNRQLSSVTEGSEGRTGLNLFAYDEYRLSTSRSVGENSFMGMSFGNENANVVGQWVFPISTGDMFGNGQGGTGNAKEIATFSFHALWDERYWTQIAFTSGYQNNNWDDGSNTYIALMYNIIPTQSNDLWAGIEYYFGQDAESIMTPHRNSIICPGTCPDGVTDSSLRFIRTPGGEPITGAPVEEVDKFASYKLRVDWTGADHGPHSWAGLVQLHGMHQDFDSGGEVDKQIFAIVGRYFYNRTYGIEAYWRDNLTYEYTTPAGVKRDTVSDPAYGARFLWYPAMNFNIFLNYIPNTSTVVFEGDEDRQQSGGYSYVLGTEYNF